MYVGSELTTSYHLGRYFESLSYVLGSRRVLSRTLSMKCSHAATISEFLGKLIFKAQTPEICVWDFWLVRPYSTSTI